MSISQVSGGKVWNIPVEVEDNPTPTPTIPVKQRRFSRLSFDDAGIIAILCAAILIALFSAIFWNSPIDLSFMSPFKQTINASNSGYILQGSNGVSFALVSCTIGSAIVMLVTAIMSVYFLYKKSIVSTAKVIAVLTIPFIVILVGTAFIATAGKSSTNNISLKDWVKERYSVSLPTSVNTTSDAFKDGIYFRNANTKDVLELKETDGRVYLYNLNGEEVKPTVSEGK